MSEEARLFLWALVVAGAGCGIGYHIGFLRASWHYMRLFNTLRLETEMYLQLILPPKKEDGESVAADSE